MAAHHGSKRNPYTQPGFIVAALTVAVISTLGITLVALNISKDGPHAQSPPPWAISTDSHQKKVAPALASDSICSLPPETSLDPLKKAPETMWKYHGAVAYPTSATFGPGVHAKSGIRKCYQHAPAGALFSAANAVVQGSDPDLKNEWSTYFLSKNVPGRAELTPEDRYTEQTSQSHIRAGIFGFKFLTYSGNAAHIDIAVQGIGEGKSVYASVVYSLVWEDGDWKLTLPHGASTPLTVTELPDATDYTRWSP